ncbi:MAG TPA: hypothetical protein PKL77_00220 [Candidatus Omnitrophota bacterium]|nr:hypothetical protein [Candidatus Omnitrophota bacterium]
MKSGIQIFLLVCFVFFPAMGAYAEVYQSTSQNTGLSAQPQVSDQPSGQEKNAPSEKGTAPQGGPGGEMKIPQAALDACNGKKEGDTCQCQGGPGGNTAGSCGYTPDKKFFACKPNCPPPDMKHEGNGQQERPGLPRQSNETGE